MKKKKAFVDLIWSVMAVCFLHGVLQLAVYPYINRRLGAEMFGDVLYVLAILGIMSPAAGLAANNRRLIDGGKTTENGDYLLAMLPHVILYSCLFLVLCKSYFSGVGQWLAAILLVVFTLLRFYGDVGYRMSLNYKGYFVYYLVVSAGYVLGLLLYPLSGSWLLCILLGEALCLLPSAISGIYWPLKLSPQWKSVGKQTALLSFSYLLSNTVLYLDRLLLQNLVNGNAVSVYYIASLLGKTAALLITPLNSVIIGYLSKYRIRINRRNYLRCGIVSIGAGAIIYLCILLVVPIFTRWFYPDLFDSVMEISSIANLAQILFFIASPLLVIMLTFCDSAWQLAVQIAYAAVFIPACYLGVRIGGVRGFVWGGVASNLFRLLLVLIVGFVLSKNNGGEEQKDGA